MLLTNALALLVLTASWDSLSELHHHIPEQQSFQRGLLGCLWTEGSSTIRCHVGGGGGGGGAGGLGCVHVPRQLCVR